MKTIFVVLVAAVLLIICFVVFIPGAESRLSAAKEQSGEVVDNLSSDEHLEQRVKTSAQKDWDGLQDDFGTIVDIENDIVAIKKEAQSLKDQKAKDKKYLAKADEILANHSFSQDLIPIGDSTCSRRELEKDMEVRYARCQEIDQQLKLNKELLKKQEATLADLRKRYEVAKEIILADLTEADQISKDLARLKLEERMYQRLDQYNKSKTFQARTESRRAMQSFRERLTKAQKSVRMYQESSLPGVVRQEDSKLERAFDQELSGKITDKVRDYLAKNGNQETDQPSSEESLEGALENATID